MATKTHNKMKNKLLTWEFYEHATVEDVRQAIKDGCDVNGTDNDNRTPLMNAVEYPKLDVIKCLLDAGADVNARSKYGCTVLTMVNTMRATADCYKLLLDAGADVHAKRNIGTTALLEHASHGPVEALKVLIDAGADVNIKDENNWTPLHAAASFHEDVNAVKLLIESGADLEAKDNKGRTPLMHAARWGSHPSNIRCLIKAGANMEFEDDTIEDLIKENYTIMDKIFAKFLNKEYKQR